MARYKEPKLHTEHVIGSLDSLLSPFHPARAIWEWLEQNLPEEVFGSQFNNDETGASAHDRRRMLGVWILAYLFSVTSSVQVAEMCTRILEYRWMCGDNPPSHTLLSQFRASSEKQLERVVVEVVEDLKKKARQ